MSEPTRCWSSTDPLYSAYHDDEWGRPVTDERGLLERLCLERWEGVRSDDLAYLEGLKNLRSLTIEGNYYDDEEEEQHHDRRDQLPTALQQCFHRGFSFDQSGGLVLVCARGKDANVASILTEVGRRGTNRSMGAARSAFAHSRLGRP